MREQAFRFGSDDHLVGIAGLTDTAAPIGVVVLNAGMVYRIGLFRMHVDLTRRLNAAGYPTLRMDLSTLGDSRASAHPLSHADQVLADVGAGMNLLAAHAGCRRFVLIGSCSGAANAHIVARRDARVAGVIFLDGFAYRTPGYRLRHYLPRLLSARRWLRRMQATLEKRAARDRESLSFEVAVPPRATVRADYTDMLARGLKLCFVYSGGISERFNAARQFGEMYGKLAAHPEVTVHYLAPADHSYVLVGDRQRLLDTINAWLADAFPIPSQ